MRALVCGGRLYDDKDFVAEVLSGLQITELCHGAAPGADTLAGDWAVSIARVKTIAYPANWDQHGKAAGPMRNNWMLEDFKPDIVIAFPGGPGTAHMIKIAKRAGVSVLEAVRIS